MLDKLIEINLKAHESLVQKGNYDDELNELSHMDISQRVIEDYRKQYPDLAYIYQKIEENGYRIELGVETGCKVPLEVLRDMAYSQDLKTEIQKFLEWKPDYSKYDIGSVNNIQEFKASDDISKLSMLQGSRVEQIEQIKKLTRKRRRETKFYYADDAYHVFGNGNLSAYRKFEIILSALKDYDYLGTGERKEPVFEFKNKPYSFTRCLSKAGIPTKRWTTVANGSRPLRKDIHLALTLAFYLGINTLEDVEAFLNNFGISLNSSVEMINTATLVQIKKAIEVGIHYDNILFYLNEGGFY